MKYSITIFVEIETKNSILTQQKIIELIENHEFNGCYPLVSAGIREDLEDD